MKKLLRSKREVKKGSISDLIDELKGSTDFTEYALSEEGGFYLYYFDSLVDSTILHHDVLDKLHKTPITSVDQLKETLPIKEILLTDDVKKIKKHLLSGFLLFFLSKEDGSYALIKASKKEKRQVSVPDVEFSVIGPKESFVEDLDTNLNLIRNRLPSADFIIKQLEVGKLTKTRVAILYVKGVASDENVSTVLQRIEDIQIDQVVDSSFISQLLSDHSNSPFPQTLDTERPDRVTSSLIEGGIVILVNGSPHAQIAPATFISFFSSFEDYYIHWLIASAFRIIRIFSIFFSIMATPLYVATLTYHYVLIPKDLLITLVASRMGVPLPPVLEALFLELAIELLREAGARLPMKIGQTIGIVGGIVIGTASVEAGLTSNVLLIIVAIAALASFTTPIYQMGNTVRFLRFPLLLAAYLYGLPGIVFCLSFMMIHLLNLTTLGRPYLEPLYPPRTKDYKDTLIRLPFSLQSKRPVMFQTESTIRFRKTKAIRKNDIDD